MSRLLLSAEDEFIYRSAASDSWRKSGGSIMRARRMFTRDPRIAGLDPMTVLMLVQIAIKLWRIWHDRKVTEPESVQREDEPCFRSVE